MSTAEAQTKWDAFNTPFPSLQDYESRGGGSQEEEPFQVDKVEDGEYTLHLEHMTEPKPDRFAPDPAKARPVVMTYWRVIGADDPGDVGKVLRKKLTYTGHPRGAAYPFLKVAYGGKIPPDVQPTFSKLKDLTIRAFLTEVTTTLQDGKSITYQDWQAIQKAKEPF